MSLTTSLLSGFSSLQVLVVGDAMLDVYVRGRSQRLCQEAAVPIVEFGERREAPGGAANTALNLRALGANVKLLSVVGRDREGRHLRDLLATGGVDVQRVLAHPRRRTLSKQRIMVGSQLIVRLDQGDTQALSPPDQHAVATRLAALAESCDAVVVSDYDYGTVGPQVIAALAGMRASHPLVVGDSKRLARFGGVHFAAVKPNYAQAAELLGATQLEGAGRVEQMLRLSPQIGTRVDADLIALTLDQDGAIVCERDRPPFRTYAEPNPQMHSAGAGDTYVAALTLALASGADARQAAEVAATAAAVVVARDGTSCCTGQQLQQRLSGRLPAANLETLIPQLQQRRDRGERIVLTNGCFDILHRGHVTYLHQARALGDLLVCGVNGDETIRRLKGPDRPINTLEDRLEVLAALSCVDYVVAFQEDTPHRLVKAIRPHVFAKGGDYTRERLPEAALVEELGGRVEILPLLRERSTSNVITRIRGTSAGNSTAAIGPAGPLAFPLSARLT